MRTELKTCEVATTNDWNIVVDATHFGHKIVSLGKADRNSLFKAVAGLCDGYGKVGYMPEGYDWSGIRDSTPYACVNMARAAKEFFAERGITTYVVEVTKYT